LIAYNSNTQTLYRIESHNAYMAPQRYWYGNNGSIVGFLDYDEKSLFTQAGKYFAFIDNKYIHGISGEPIGYIDVDGKNIFSPSGTHLGYFEP
jgi:hypothetical protein